MPTIESRIVTDICYDRATSQYIGVAYDSFTGDKLAEIKQDKLGQHPNWISQALYDAVSSLLKEWPTCDQTSTSELQYLKITT